MELSQKERIVDQAMQMFVTQGIKAVRMDDIAQALGVSKRTLYEIFSDKEELLYQAMNRYFEVNEARQNEIMAKATNVLEALFMVLGDVMDLSETANRLRSNLQKFHPAVYNRLMQEGDEKRRVGFRKTIEKGISEGLFITNINIDLAIAILYDTVSALIVRKELIVPQGMSDRKAFVQIVSTFFRGISTTKGIALIDIYLETHHSELE